MLKTGDLVLMKDSKPERGVWPIGRVTVIYESNDGVVRKAIVKTKDGTYMRSTNKLAI